MKQAKVIAAVTILSWFCVNMFVSTAQADCDNKAKHSTPDSDFEYIAQGAVVHHKKTGLEWQRCPEGMTFIDGTAADHSQDACTGAASTFSLDKRLQLIAKVNTGSGRDGHTDWRLPTLEELSSIVENACQIPAINSVVFPDTPVTWFWAASPKVLPEGSGKAWGIGFGAGGYYIGLNNYGAVRLVRGIRK
jgi:hypothetical protein